jgi:hypothetical protein
MDPPPGFLEDFVADALNSFLLSLAPQRPPKRTGFNRDPLMTSKLVRHDVRYLLNACSHDQSNVSSRQVRSFVLLTSSSRANSIPEARPAYRLSSRTKSCYSADPMQTGRRRHGIVSLHRYKSGCWPVGMISTSLSHAKYRACALDCGKAWCP